MTTPRVRTLDISDLGLAAPTDIEAVALRAVRRLRLILNEWFIDPFRGIPYEILFSSQVGEAQIAAILVDELQRIPNVVGVIVTHSRINRLIRRYEFGATLDTDFGSTVVELST